MKVIQPFTRCAETCIRAWLLIPLSTFTLMSLFRLVDGDEGFYLIAGRMVADGFLPYRDFFYPQAPLLPHLVALLIECFGPSWYIMRLLSAACAVGIAQLLYLHLRRNFGENLALVGMLSFSFSSLALPWLSVLKTYGFSQLLIMSAFFWLAKGSGGDSLKCFISGVFLGCALGVRIYLAILAPVYCLWIMSRERGGRSRVALVFALGVLLGALPVCMYWWAYPTQFVFDNFLYHTQRSYHEASWNVTLDKFLTIIWMLGGSLADLNLEGLEFLALFLPAILVVLDCVKRRAIPSLSLLTAFTLTAVSFLPSPVQPQYFCIVVPFLIINCCEAVYIFGRSVGYKGNNFRLGTVLLLSCWLILSGSSTFYRFIISGVNVPGVREIGNTPSWKISTIREVGAAVDSLAPLDHHVLSWWPGYFFETKARLVSGLENHFAAGSWNFLSAQERKFFGVVTHDEIASMITEQIPCVVVAGNWVFKHREIEALLLAHAYRQVDQIKNAKLYINTIKSNCVR